MPYWDWSRGMIWPLHLPHLPLSSINNICSLYIDSADIAGSAIWGSHPEVGLGAFGNPSKNFSVDTGALRNLTRAYPERHIVQRQYALRVSASPPFSFSSSNFDILFVNFQPFEQQIFPWQFNFPRKEANTTQTPAEWKKIVTSFTGNYTAFQAYIDGFRAEGLHNAAHIVSTTILPLLKLSH